MRLQAAKVQVRLATTPLDALLLAMATTNDSLASQSNVLPAVEQALLTAMVRATEDSRIDMDQVDAGAMTLDGSMIATHGSKATPGSAAGESGAGLRLDGAGARSAPAS